MNKTIAVAYYYLKAILGGLLSGVTYLSGTLGTNFTWYDLTHMSAAHWFWFLIATFGVGGLTAAVTNGPKPATTDTPATRPIAYGGSTVYVPVASRMAGNPPDGQPVTEPSKK